MISPKRFYLTTDKSTVVHHDDPRANSLLVGQGCFLEDATARRHGLLNADREFVMPPAPEALAPESEDDMKTSENENSEEATSQNENSHGENSQNETPDADHKSLDTPPATKAVRGPKATK